MHSMPMLYMIIYISYVFTPFHPCENKYQNMGAGLFIIKLFPFILLQCPASPLAKVAPKPDKTDLDFSAVLLDHNHKTTFEEL